MALSRGEIQLLTIYHLLSFRDDGAELTIIKIET